MKESREELKTELPKRTHVMSRNSKGITGKGVGGNKAVSGFSPPEKQTMQL